MSEYQPVEIARGAAMLLTFTMVPYTDPNGVVTPPPDITDWAINLQLRDAFGNPALLTVSATVVNATTYTVALTGGTGGHTDRQSGDYLFDTWRTDAGEETPLDNGPLKLSASRFGA